MKQGIPTEPLETASSKRAHFEREMAKISFQELQKFFAKGMMIKVDSAVDLIEVAIQIHTDNTDQVQQWMDSKVLVRAHDEHAQKWVANRAVFMAVTVAPWVLVQEINAEVK